MSYELWPEDIEGIRGPMHWKIRPLRPLIRNEPTHHVVVDDELVGM